MHTHDEELLSIPNYFCPGCQTSLDISKRRFEKMSRKAIREQRSDDTACYDVNLAVVTCNNYHCAQYNRFKVVRLPRVKCATVGVDLEQ